MNSTLEGQSIPSQPQTAPQLKSNPLVFDPRHCWIDQAKLLKLQQRKRQKPLYINLTGVGEVTEGKDSFINVCFEMDIPKSTPDLEQIELVAQIEAKPHVTLGQGGTGNIFEEWDPAFYIVHRMLPGSAKPRTTTADGGLEFNVGLEVPVPLLGGKGSANVGGHYNVKAEGQRFEAVFGRGGPGGDNRSFVMWTIVSTDRDKNGGIQSHDFFLKFYGRIEDNLELQIFSTTTWRRPFFLAGRVDPTPPPRTFQLNKVSNEDDVEERLKEINVRRKAKKVGRIFQVLQSPMHREYRS
ncbi:hypothetical protein T439DRAFT_330150 [Meredithblackwellia eburnea MCA 4105]